MIPLALALQLSLGAFAPQQAGSAPLEAALEMRVQHLGKELRCAVCQGLSIADSPASMARSQLDKVRELVSQGKSDDEIREYFVARYGEWVLLEPTKRGLNLLVWLGPLALLLIGGIAIAWQLRRAKTPAAGPAAPAVGGPEDEYLKAVRSELER